MAQEKTFDKADLLKFFYETGMEAQVGRFRVVAPSPTLFGETEVTNHGVEARTQALWCERYGLAIVVQSIGFPDGGKHIFGDKHPLRQERRAQVRYCGEEPSGRLVRWVTDLADAWRDEVAQMLPQDTIDLRVTRQVEGTDVTTVSGTFVHSELWQAIAALREQEPAVVPLEEPAAEPTDEDHYPTGTGIDDPFGDEEQA